MALHITKVAFRSEGPAALRAWLESHAHEARITTRYLPKRVSEMEGGSLYWIHAHMLIGRSPLIGFEETGEGRYWVRLSPMLIPVRASAKRAHQGWRYLEDKDAPVDLNGDEAEELDAMPAKLLGELTRLGLV